MKYLFGMLIFLYFLMMSTYVCAQNNEIYGLWANFEGEYVEIAYDNTFLRYTVDKGTKKKIPLATGSIKFIENELRIFRSDISDTYDLCYYVGYANMVICRPKSEKAWLWQKLKDL
jgi:hypothetical protein